MGSQRAIRIFLLLMVIQLYCEILLAENSEKHSKPNFIVGTLIGKSKYSSEKFDLDDIENHDDSQYLDDDDFDAYIINQSDNTTNLRLLSDRRVQSNSDLHVTKVPARRSQFSDSKRRDNLRQLSNRIEHPDSDTHVIKTPARRSQFSDSERRDNLRQLSNRIEHPDSDLHVTKVPARRSQFSDSERRDNLRQLSNRIEHPDSDTHVTKAPARRSKSPDNDHLDSDYLDDSDYLEQYSDISPLLDLRNRQFRRRNLEISPQLKSEHSDIEHVLKQPSDHERQNLHPEAAYVIDLASARRLQATRKFSRFSLRSFEYPDSNYVRRSNSRENLSPAVKSTKLDVRDTTLLPQFSSDHPEDPERFHYDEDIIIAY